jgi:Prion-inhibition and propagation
MADPGALVIGVVGLGALYSTCVECLSVFRKIRAFDRDYDFLASRLWTEQALLMLWGQRMVLLTGKMRDLDPQLQDPYQGSCSRGTVLHRDITYRYKEIPDYLWTCAKSVK